LILKVKNENIITKKTVTTYIAMDTQLMEWQLNSPFFTFVRRLGYVKPSTNIMPELTTGGSKDAERATPESADETPDVIPREIPTPENVAMVMVVIRLENAGGPLDVI
jgi:hypothetical protein